MGNGEINIKIGPGIISSPLAEGCGTLGSVWKTITIRRTEKRGGEVTVMGGAPRANIQTMGYIHITTQSPPVTVTEAAQNRAIMKWLLFITLKVSRYKIAFCPLMECV